MIGAPLDLGQGRRGVDMGPSAIRYAELDVRIRALGRAVYDWGDVALGRAGGDRRGRRRTPATSARSSRRASGSQRWSRRRSARSSCRSCSAATTRSRWARSAGWRRRAAPGATLWIDAHGDLNRPSTSPTGNVHGMPLAAALGAGGDVVPQRPLPDAVGDARGARRHPLARPGRARADQASSTCASTR